MKEAKKSIIDNGYINIVTGYRSLFGKKDEFGNFKFNNKYFSQLENVYLFDRDLKSVYLRYLITTKKNISNRIAHVFSESHLNIPNAYTSSINFDENLVDSEGAAFLRLQDSIKKVIRKGKKQINYTS